MLAIISPAKKLDITPCLDKVEYSQPEFLDKSQELIDILKDKGCDDVQDLMNLSDKLALLNFERFHSYSTPFNLENSKQAMYIFSGDTYTGLDADSFSENDVAFAQGHLRILSGLYGLLRPLDLMQAYRLEMGTKLQNKHGNNLYDFWGDNLSNACDEVTKTHSDKRVVCLASNEYMKAINLKSLKSPILNCEFKEHKDGKLKVIGLFAKRARGMMARYIIQNRIEEGNGLRAFADGGYEFDEGLSTEDNFVFVR